jgi:hypothetical protein
VSLFSDHERIKQDDPTSHILYNVIADMLVMLIALSMEDGQVDSLVSRMANGEAPVLH